MIEEKAWGRVEHIFHSNSAAVSLLEVKQGTRCSRHKHDGRNNLFYVQEGRIVVEQWSSIDDTKTLTVLFPGDRLTVNSPVKHRFRVLKSGRVVEVYYPCRPSAVVSLDDIHRYDEGGQDDLTALKAELDSLGIDY